MEKDAEGSESGLPESNIQEITGGTAENQENFGQDSRHLI
jgi:hypothetical protein